MYHFIYCLVLFVSGLYHLHVVDFNNFQDLELEEFEQQAVEEGKYGLYLLSHAVMSHCTSLTSSMMLSWLVVYCVSCGLSSFVM
jgi:hypothetical protein